MVGDGLLMNFCWILQTARHIRGVCKGIGVLKILNFVIALICDTISRGQIPAFLKFIRIFSTINTYSQTLIKTLQKVFFNIPIILRLLNISLFSPLI